MGGTKVLSRDLSYVAKISTGSHEIIPSMVAVSLDHLYAPCSVRAPFRICPRRTIAPFVEVTPFLPSLGISQPPSDIALEVTTNGTGRHVVAAFEGLPYLFVYNGAHEHIHTIRFFGRDVAQHSETREVISDGILGIGLKSFWSSLDMTHPNVIAAATLRRAYLIPIVGNSQFEHAATVQFSTDPAADRGDEHVNLAAIRELKINGNSVFVRDSGTPHLLTYRFDL